MNQFLYLKSTSDTRKNLKMNMEFLLKIDFLGIISNYIAIKNLDLNHNGELSFKEHLIEVRRIFALEELFWLNERDDKTVIIHSNRQPWDILCQNIEDHDLGIPITNSVFDYFTQDGFRPSKRQEIKEKYPIECIKIWQSTGRGSYRITKSKNSENRKQILEKFGDCLENHSAITRHTLNICSNKSDTLSNLIRQRTGLTCELSNALKSTNVREMKFLEQSNLGDYFKTMNILSIIPFIGKIPEKYSEDMIDRTLSSKTVIYLITSIESDRDLTLDNISPEINTILRNMIENNEEIRRIILECKDTDNEKGNEVFFNKLIIQDKKNLNNVGIIFLISFVYNLLESIEKDNIKKYFFSVVNDKFQKKWEIRFEPIEIEKIYLD
jgi:hypothetical protein